MTQTHNTKPLEGITDIIFDLGGVLLDLDMEGMKEACRRLGVQPELFFVKADAENTSTVCQGMSASRVITDYQVGTMTTPQFIDCILSHCPKDITPEIVTDAWNACIATIPQERLDLIRDLRRQGYRTHLLSNTNDLHWEYIKDLYFRAEGYTCADLFDQVLVSHEVHLAKPDPEIYRLALRRIGAAPEHCIFIDDAEVNTAAASREGIHGLWLDLSKEDTIHLIQRVLPPISRLGV